MLGIITPNILRRRSKLRGIELKEYEDDELRSIFTYAVHILETETGRVFAPQEKNDFKLNFTGNHLITTYYPIIEIKTLTVNKTPQNLENLKIDYEKGIIYLPLFFTSPFESGYRKHYFADIKVEYVAGYTIIPVYIEELVIDIFFALIRSYESDIDGIISHIAENKVQIGYDTKRKYFNNIDDRLDALKAVRMNII